MKPSERDNLLIRLDERTNNIWRTVEKLEQHNSEQNGYIAECLTRTSIHSKMIKIIYGSIGSIAAAFFTKLGGLW